MRDQRLIQLHKLLVNPFILLARLLFFGKPRDLAFICTILVAAGRYNSHLLIHLIDILVPTSNIVAHAAPLLHKIWQFDPIEHALLVTLAVTRVLMCRFSEAISIVNVVALVTGDCTDLL